MDKRKTEKADRSPCFDKNTTSLCRFGRQSDEIIHYNGMIFLNSV